jgi:uncharacterized protein involved in outer membrane biogenesis
MRWGRLVFAIVAALLVLPLLALLVFIATFNPNRYAPGLIAAVDRATGRQLVLGSPIHLKMSLNPTIEATQLSLLNPPGFAGPNFLTLDRLEARIALLPLLSHHLDITDLVLVRPNLLLQRDAAGRADWSFAPPAPASPQGQGGVAAVARRPEYRVTVESVDVQNGQITIEPSGNAKPAVIALDQLSGTAQSGTAPLTLTASLVYNGVPFTVAGTLGPIARFSGIGSGPWPVDLTVNGSGASVTVQGGITQPAAGHGYDLTVNASVPALPTLAPLLPPGWQISLTPVQNVTLSARIVDQFSPIPAVDQLVIKAGPSDLSSLQPSLTLTALDIEMASLDKPLTIFAAGASGGLALSLTGNFGAVQSLFNPALLPASMPPQGSFPVSIQAQAGTAKLTVTGAIATPAQLAGAALAITASIPDVSALSPLAGAALPVWKNLQLQTTLIDPGGLGLRKAAGLDSVVATMNDASFGGAASLYFGAQPRLQAELSAQQINLDAILAAVPASPPAPAATAAPAASASPTAPAAQVFIIPTRPLPLGLLKTASADVQLSADTLVFNNAHYTALQAHAVLAGGVLTLNPLTAEAPGGSVTASASLDATQDPARASLTVNAPALALPPFLKAAGLPDSAQGTMQARLNVTGAGDSLHAMAATMNGQLGLALVNGIVDGAVLDELFGAPLRFMDLPESLVGAQGPVPVRCFALRVDAANGAGAVRALTLDSSRLLMQGGGTLDFGAETLAVVLRPQVKIGGNPVGVPVEIGGTFANPSDSIAGKDILAAAGNSAAGLASALAETAGGGSLLGNVATAIGLGSKPDVCPDALSLGRLGQPGPAAAGLPPANPADGAPPPPGPKSLLNSLFSK